MLRSLKFFLRNTPFLFLTLGLVVSCNDDELTKPNIILIMADDLGYGELGCYGQKLIKTPNIDLLAQEGMKFTNFYAGSPVCAPSRCVLLTGKHSGHAFVRDNYEMGGYLDEEEGGQLPLPEGTFTLGTMLQQRGYKTAVIGKWGLGGPGSTGVPTKQGFDYFYGYLCQKQAHNYYPTHLWENEAWDSLHNEFVHPHQSLEGDPDKPASFEKYQGDEYSMDKMMEKATGFIKENQKNPFFLYLPFTIPHLALQVPDESLEEYTNQFDEEPYIGNRSYLPHDTPKAAYAAMITRMDMEIGKIKMLITELGIEKNTVIMFTSDNGPTYGGIGGSDTEFFNSSGGLRGLKGSVYEGGIKVPLIAHWPGNISPGSESDHLAAFEDFLPTLADLCGVQSDAGTDGISFTNELLGQNNQENHDFLYWEFPAYGGQQALRADNWKAVRTKLKKDSLAPLQLYDLEDDPKESIDVSEDHPDIVKEMLKLMLAARTPSDTFQFNALDDTSYIKQIMP